MVTQPVLVAVLSLLAVGQSSGGAVTRDLINQLGEKDRDRVMEAADTLVKQGSSVIPVLVEALDRRPECQMQFVASGVLRRIEPQHSRVEATLAKLARGECSGWTQEDVILKQDAAFALADTASGLKLLVEMISHKDLLTRRRVAFTFEDLTEKIEYSAEGLGLSAQVLDKIVPLIAETLPRLSPFLSERDEVLRCVTLEALQQASESRHASVAAAGRATLAGKKVNCRR
jgi:hypothetical protein